MNQASSRWTLALKLRDVCCKATVREPRIKKISSFETEEKKVHKENSIKVIKCLLLKVEKLTECQNTVILQMSTNSHPFSLFVMFMLEDLIFDHFSFSGLK